MKSKLLNRVLAGGFSALLAVLLAKNVSTHPFFLALWTVLAGISGYIMVAPKEFYQNFKTRIGHFLDKLEAEEKKRLAEREKMNEYREFLRQNHHEYQKELVRFHYLKLADICFFAASYTFTLAFGFSFIFERGFSESFKYAGVICVVAWCICFVALIEDYLKLLKDDKRNLYKDNPDAVTMAKKLATIRESNRTQKQTVIQSILLPVYAMWLIAQYVWCPLRQPVKLAQVIFIALAMTCFKVQSLGRYTTAISAMIGFATGIYCNNSELVALFVGGLSGEVLLHLSRFMLRFLPDPETPLPSFS